MEERIDVISLGASSGALDWPLGDVWSVAGHPDALHHLLQERLEALDAAYLLFWDVSSDAPEPERVLEAKRRPGDLWHAGLRLGTAGKPDIVDFVHPTWMLNCDPDPHVEATSWRVSLRACLVRTEVLRQMGGPRPTFQSLEAAALEMGHRYIQRGVLMRHVPGLVPEEIEPVEPVLSAEDEMRFVYYRFGRRWSLWALGRALVTGYRARSELLAAWRCVRRASRPADPAPFQRERTAGVPEEDQSRISVLIPTLDRYVYLRTLLDQLRKQTVSPLEVIIIDQTPADRRDTTLGDDFADLPVQILYREQAGQCSSRNAGLQQMQGCYVLLSDDDIEVSPTFIEDHVHTIRRFRADASSGVAREGGGEPPPEHFRYVRTSDVFPAGITLVRRTVLEQAGLFDLAYEHGQRADGDLGMRAYLSGALMVLNPEISVLHHRAPRGGLRAHRARVITYASSRSRVLHRNLPSVSEIYLAKRYFHARQVREMLWMRVFGTFSIRGNLYRKGLKLVASLLTLPHTLWEVRKRYRQVSRMLQEYPQIPVLHADGQHAAFTR